MELRDLPGVDSLAADLAGQLPYPLPEPKEIEIPSEMVGPAEEARAALLEAAAESDEALLDKYIGGEEISLEELIAGLRTATIAGSIRLTFCGSALRNRGIQPILDAVVEFLPSPVEVPAAVAVKVGGKQEGQEVTVSFDIRGREYNGRYFNNLQAWKMVPAEGGAAGGDDKPPVSDKDVPAEFDDYEDDIPF